MATISARALGEATVQELREAIRGEVVTPADAEYGEASQIWNGAFDDSRPALIVRCTDASDVATAIGFARSNDLQVAVRGGGHSIAGFSTIDDGVVIDLSPMRAVVVDPTRRRAVVQGGATWQDVDHETQAFGLAVTGGLISSTGVGGFTLGGGIGWLMRKYRLVADNLVGAAVVTADAQLVHASATDNPDLFWALRGGGGNFGIVTSFEFELHHVGPTVMAGLLFFPPEAASTVITGWRKLTETMPDELTSLINLTTAPPVPFLPEAVHGKPIVVIGAMYSGTLDTAEAAVASLRTLAEPIVDMVGPVPYAAMQQALDPLWGAGAQNYFTSELLEQIPDAAIDTLLTQWTSKPSPESELHIQHAGGAVGRVDPAATAYSHRSASYVVNVIAKATETPDFTVHTDWARTTRSAVSRHGTDASYVNFTGEASPEQVRASYPPATSARLVDIKRRYDPTNLFRLNQNISPHPLTN